MLNAIMSDKKNFPFVNWCTVLIHEVTSSDKSFDLSNLDNGCYLLVADHAYCNAGMWLVVVHNGVSQYRLTTINSGDYSLTINGSILTLSGTLYKALRCWYIASSE